MCPLMWLASGSRSPGSGHGSPAVGRARRVGQLSVPRRGGHGGRGYRSSLPDRVTPAPAPLRSIRWKNFPALLTSQPCHLPAAAWIRNAALNPCGAGRRRACGQPWFWVVQSFHFSFHFARVFAFLLVLFFFFFPDRGENRLSSSVSDVVLCVLLVLTTRKQDFPELFVCWQEGPGLLTVGTGPVPVAPRPLPRLPSRHHSPFFSVTLPSCTFPQGPQRRTPETWASF